MAIATFVENDASGPVFDLNLEIPDETPGDMRASLSMIESIEAFYGVNLNPLSDGQGHTLLCARDYAKACVDRLYPRFRRPLAKVVAVLIATYVLADEEREADVRSWSDRRFRGNADVSAVSRTKRFPEVADWIAMTIEIAKEQGADF